MILEIYKEGKGLSFGKTSIGVIVGITPRPTNQYVHSTHSHVLPSPHPTTSPIPPHHLFLSLDTQRVLSQTLADLCYTARPSYTTYNFPTQNHQYVFSSLRPNTTTEKAYWQLHSAFFDSHVYLRKVSLCPTEHESQKLSFTYTRMRIRMSR